ncbi:Ssn2 protein [Saccharomycopsis crataegensis]|uniref:Mediator of RNA polymerase II transcription subunit 13 n=1 Tax=Saccharomycopsis crataegensis TaxID=43959 RepID=A0AAV5QE97_9ASCO|nr:Ssn2 protein [Saccharomycopsis crataegensis]
MHSGLHPEDSFTNFYRVLKIRQIKYSVFVSSVPSKNEQILLEAELHMRNSHKEGLLFSTNKELWAFGLNDEEVPVPLEKFNMKCKESNIILPSMIFTSNNNHGSDTSNSLDNNTSKKNSENLDYSVALQSSSAGTNDNSNSTANPNDPQLNRDPKYPNFLYRVLLNAIKKKILLNLSIKNCITPFGDASIINSQNRLSDFLLVDPQVAFNGDVLISIATKPSNLINLSKYLYSINSQSINNSYINNSNFALYLAPSGIRAYFANHNLMDSLAPTPSNCNNLFIMLHVLMGILFNKKVNEIRWVKLIPDLRHLNGMTPQISKYLKPVQNQKFVIWPLDLCYIQKGELFNNSSNIKVSVNDPFEFVDDFIDLQHVSEKVSSNMNASQKTQDTKIDAANIEIEETNAKLIPEEDSQEIKVEYDNDDNDDDDDDVKVESNKTITPINVDSQEPQDDSGNSNNWNDLDEELFGENNGVTDADFNFFDDSDDDVIANEDAMAPEEQKHHEEVMMNEIRHKTSPSETRQSELTREIIKSIDGNESDAPMARDVDENVLNEIHNNKPAFDIPKDEMCLPSTPYNDPGAPLPVTNTPASTHQSIFSPLKFNPVIREVVDNKYDKGGKFHVPHSMKPTSKIDISGDHSGSTNINNKGYLNKILPSPSVQSEDYSIVVHSSDEDLTSDSDSDSQKDEDEDEDEDDDDYDYDMGELQESGKEQENGEGNENILKGNSQDVIKNDNDQDNSEDSLKEPNPVSTKHSIAELQAEVVGAKDSLNNGRFDIELDPRVDTKDDSSINFNSLENIDNTKLDTNINYQNIRTPELPQTKTFQKYSEAPKAPTPLSAAVTPNETTNSPNVEHSNSSTPTSGVLGSSNNAKAKKQATVRYHDFSNWIQFSTKWIPLYTIPERYFHNNPIISEKDLKVILPFLVNALAFDRSMIERIITRSLKLKEEPLKCLDDYNSLADLIQSTTTESHMDDTIDMNDFENYFDELDFNDETSSTVKKFTEDQEDYKNIEEVINSLFSSMKKIQLVEYVGLADDCENKYDFINSLISTDNNDYDDPMMNDNYLEEFGNEAYAKELQEYVFDIPPPLCKVRRMNQEMTVDLVTLKMWKILSFSPLYEKHDIRLLFVINEPFAGTKRSKNILEISSMMVNNIAKSYESCGLGSAGLVSGREIFEDFELSGGLVESLRSGSDNSTVQVLTRIKNGVFNINYQGNSGDEYFETMKQKFDILGKILVRINDLDAPRIVILFGNTFTDLSAILKTVSVFSNFHSQISQIDDKNAPSFQILPTKTFLKDNFFTLPSQNFFHRLSLSLYNKYTDESQELFSKLMDRTPRKINFQLTKEPIANTLMNEELYIHLAYERSADKNWCVASWSDQWGRTRKVRSWYVYPISNSSLSKIGNGGKLNSKDSIRKTFEQVTNDMWQETAEFAKNHNGKYFLVLTRLNGVIIDEELAHWKRLSQGTSVQIILVTVNSNPRLILKNFGCPFPFKKMYLQQTDGSGHAKSSKKKMYPNYNSEITKIQSNIDHIKDEGSTNKFAPESNGAHAAESPDFYQGSKSVIANDSLLSTNETLSLNDLENGEISTHDIKIMSASEEFYGVILKSSIPLSNSINKFAFRTGYLIKPLNNTTDERLLTFEVNLLSYPSYFTHMSLLRELLTQFRNLVAVNSLLGDLSDEYSSNDYGFTNICAPDSEIGQSSINNESLMPWHIRAVKKVMNVLVHVRVE